MKPTDGMSPHVETQEEAEAASASSSASSASSLHLVHSRLHNMFFDSATSMIGVFHYRDSEVSRQERLRETSAARIQVAFRATRFGLAEEARRASARTAAEWLQRLVRLPAYASRLVAQFAVEGGPLPRGMPVLLHRWKGVAVLSFPEDLSLKRRTEYAARCALSNHPVLRATGRASLRALLQCQPPREESQQQKPFLLL